LIGNHPILPHLLLEAAIFIQKPLLSFVLLLQIRQNQDQNESEAKEKNTQEEPAINIPAAVLGNDCHNHTPKQYQQQLQPNHGFIGFITTKTLLKSPVLHTSYLKFFKPAMNG
jgi:hypothetical protein